MKKTKGRLASKVGERLRALRLQAELTQGELAQKARFTAKYISELENGHRDARLTTIERLAKALRADPAELLQFGETDDVLSRIRAMIQDRKGTIQEHLVDVVAEVLRLADAVG